MGIELEPVCRRERRPGSPNTCGFRVFGVEEREPAGEIPSAAKDLLSFLTLSPIGYIVLPLPN